MCPLSGYCRKWGGGLIGCPTQLTLVTCICQLSTNTSEKYEKNTTGKSARGGCPENSFFLLFQFYSFLLLTRQPLYLGDIYACLPGEYSDVDIYSGYCAALSILDKSTRILQNSPPNVARNKMRYSLSIYESPKFWDRANRKLSMLLF